MSRLFLILLLLFGALTAHAQVQMPGCPPGVMPGQPGCGGSDNGAQKDAPAYTGPIWQDRFGALANDGNGAGGIAQNMKSMRAARKEALRDCGQRNCQIKIDVRNGCLATAWGQGVAGYDWGSDLKTAESKAISNCVSGGGANCVVKYSACSLPVRTR